MEQMKQMEQEIVKSQLEHRTIREFKQEPISSDLFDLLLEVARRTPTSNGMQSSSILRITDPKIKQSIAEICNQEYVATAPELLIFIVDQHRNQAIALEKSVSQEYAADIDRFFQGYTDACITAQNILVAAETMGLGVVYLGSILNDSRRMCQLLKLPSLTFPVVGLGIGYPNQHPEKKPRMKQELRVFENQYRIFEHYLEEIKSYDEEMENYYDLRNANQRVDSFSDQIASRLSMVNANRQQMLDVVREQGFSAR